MANLRGKIFELARFNAKPSSSSSHLTNRLTQGGGRKGGQFLNILRVRQAAAPRRSDRFQIIRATCFKCLPAPLFVFRIHTRARAPSRERASWRLEGRATRLYFSLFLTDCKRYMYVQIFCRYRNTRSSCSASFISKTFDRKISNEIPPIHYRSRTNPHISHYVTILDHFDYLRRCVRVPRQVSM